MHSSLTRMESYSIKLKTQWESLDEIIKLYVSYKIRADTGSPKNRAMEIITEIEPTKRGAYCGFKNRRLY